MPPRRRRGGDRAARERLGAAAAQLVGRARGGRAGRASPRRGCCWEAAGSASTPSSSATRATSTCPRPGGSHGAVPSSSTRSSRSTRPSSRTAAASGRPRPPPSILRRIDRIALRRADLVVADTEQNARHLAELGGLPEERLAVCFVGAEERLFRPGWQPAERFHALFVGKLIPLHGLETILAAARLAPEIPFRVVGSGQLDALLVERPPNVDWVDWVDYERLPEENQRAGCALGVFGTSAKAGRVIPNKAFQALACGTPLVTADTPGRARAAARRRERAARPARRPRGARGGRAPARRRSGARAHGRRRRARGLPRAGERGRPRRALARSRRAARRRR